MTEISEIDLDKVPYAPNRKRYCNRARKYVVFASREDERIVVFIPRRKRSKVSGYYNGEQKQRMSEQEFTTRFINYQ